MRTTMINTPWYRELRRIRPLICPGTGNTPVFYNPHIQQCSYCHTWMPTIPLLYALMRRHDIAFQIGEPVTYTHPDGRSEDAEIRAMLDTSISVMTLDSRTVVHADPSQIRPKTYLRHMFPTPNNRWPSGNMNVSDNTTRWR